MKGYQLIEPDVFLTKLITNEVPIDVILTIMYWVVQLLRNDEKIKSLPVEIDVITANYMGPYPCIGIHYINESEHDIGLEVLEKIEKYFNEASFRSFYSYIIENTDTIIEDMHKFKNTN